MKESDIYSLKCFNYLILQMYRPFICHVHSLWCFWNFLQSGDIDINNRNILVLYLKLHYSNIAFTNNSKFPTSLNCQLDQKCQNRTHMDQKMYCECLLRLVNLRLLCCSMCFCASHFVTVRFNLTCLQSLKKFFKHLLNL